MINEMIRYSPINCTTYTDGEKDKIHYTAFISVNFFRKEILYTFQFETKKKKVSLDQTLKKLRSLDPIEIRLIYD